MEQIVQFQRIAIQRTQIFVPDRFQYQPEKGWAWLQRLAIKVLRWRKCYSWIFEEQSVAITIDTQNLQKQIWEQDQETFRYYHDRGELLLLGPREYDELRQLPLNHPLSIHLRYDWAERGRDDLWQRTGHDMNVVVIPHMKGALVLPKGWNK